MEPSTGSDSIYSDSFSSSRIISLDDTEIGLHVDNAAENFFQRAIESNFRRPNFLRIPFGEPPCATGVQFGPELVPLSSSHQLSYSPPDDVYQHVEQTSDKAMTSRRPKKPRE